MNEIHSRHEKMLEAAQKMGSKLNEMFCNKREIHEKGPSDYATDADSAADEIARTILLESFPNDTYFSEDGAPQDGNSGYTFIVDPLDGTHLYMNGIPLFACSISLMKDNELVASCIYSPRLGDLFSAIKGEGAFRNKEKIQCGQKTDVDKSFFMAHCGFRKREGYLQVFNELATRADRTRSLGFIMELCYVAAGSADIFVEKKSKFYDISAAVLIAEEAGCVVRNWQGKEIIRTPEAENDVLVGNKILVENYLKIIQKISV